MINKFINFFNIVNSYLNQRVFFDKNETNFIEFNKKKWKKSTFKNNGIILVDLFPWYPWIYLWSYVVNILSLKHNLEIKFFYFDFYQTKGSKISLYIRKLIKIFDSFNVKKGLVEYDFKYSLSEKKKFNKLFDKVKNKKDLINFKKNNLKIGDLICDHYIRSTYEPTLKLDDYRLKIIFFRANKIYDEVKNYFKNNNVKYLIPSHLCYISYGIISRIAIEHKIKVIKIKSENRGNSLFRLIKIDSKCVDEPKYYYHKKNFKKLSINKKNIALKIGKKILQKRLSGKFDPTIPYILKSQFKDKKYYFKGLDRSKKKIIIFPHCFYDFPHRYRNMIFNDFYEHANYFMEKSVTLKQYEWLYKPHPHSLAGHINIHKELLDKYPNIKYIPKKVSHKQLLNLNIKCVITNHGTVAHEYAAFDIPVISTGDNPHINYNFLLNVNSKKKLDFIFRNLDENLKKIKVNKNEIYEFLYMQYKYPFEEVKDYNLIKDSFFVKKNIKINETSKILNYYIKKDKFNSLKIKTYINSFLKFHNL